MPHELDRRYKGFFDQIHHLTADAAGCLGNGLFLLRNFISTRLFRFVQALPHPRRIARILELLGKIFPSKDRATVWELPISDIVRDFRKSRTKHRSIGARGWLYCCLTFHVALTVCEAVRVCIIERIARLIRPVAKLCSKK